MSNVPNTIDATGKTDTTSQLQDWIDNQPDNQNLIFPVGAQYRIDGSIILDGRNNLGIVGSGGTRFFAPMDVTAAKGRCQFKVINGTNILFYNVEIKGSNPNGGENGDYIVDYEAQHGIQSQSVNGLTIAACRITDVYGDFVYLGNTENGPRTKNVNVTWCWMERSSRMGMTIQGVENFEISHNTIDHVRRTMFDSEPHNDRWGTINGSINDNNIGYARLNFFAANGRGGDVRDIAIFNNDLKMNMKIACSSPTIRRSAIDISGNVSEGIDGNGYGGEMRFKNWDNIRVHDNVQHLQSGRTPKMYLVKTWGCTGVIVAGNDIGTGDVGQVLEVA